MNQDKTELSSSIWEWEEPCIGKLYRLNTRPIFHTCPDDNSGCECTNVAGMITVLVTGLRVGATYGVSRFFRVRVVNATYGIGWICVELDELERITP